LESVAIEPEHGPEFCLTDARRVLQHCLEHRLQLAGRSTDDPQHLRGCCLLLQCFAQIVGALAQLVEQPRIPNGDDGLVGEILDQLDLSVGERPHFGAIDKKRANQLLPFEQRHPD
jgi:hypothetical protein